VKVEFNFNLSTPINGEPQIPAAYYGPGRIVFLFLFSLCGVSLSPLGTSATNWPIVPAPDDR
jgi:hypothetical protein